ncbi:MAG: sugar-binding protein [Cyclobacteriaceae bacterium]
MTSCSDKPVSTKLTPGELDSEQIAGDYFDLSLKKYNPLGYKVETKTLLENIDFNKDGNLYQVVSVTPIDHSTSRLKNVGRSYESFVIIGLKNPDKIYPVFRDWQADAYPKSSKIIHIQNDTLVIRHDEGRSSPDYNKEVTLHYQANNFVIHSVSLKLSAYPANGKIEKYANFTSKEAFRKYQISNAKDVEIEECTYKMFFAEKNQHLANEQLHHHISESKYIVYKPENWVDKKDLSFSTSTTWDSEFIYLNVEVTDDEVILNSGEDIIYGDHIEFWLDFSNERITKSKHDVFLEGSRFKYYRTIRNEPDSTLVQGIIGLNQNDINSSSVIINRKESTNITLESKHKLTDTGYSVEFTIPLKQLGKEIFNIDLDYSYTNELGFTVVVSDTDNSKTKKQETLMATSTLKHGNPFTLGSLFLIDKFEMPVYQSWSKCSNEIQYQYGFPRR